MEETKLQMVVEYPIIILGIKNRKEYTVYPLSWHDLKKLQKTIFRGFVGVMGLNKTAESDSEVFSFLFNFISENILDIIESVVGEQVDEKELTFEQIVELSSHIIDMNFTGLEKNVESLLQKMGLFLKKAQK